MKNYAIGNRTHNLLACNAVPQPTVPLHGLFMQQTQMDGYSLNSIKCIVTGILTDIAYIVFSKHSLANACLYYKLE